jgi:hypothetical protein
MCIPGRVKDDNVRIPSRLLYPAYQFTLGVALTAIDLNAELVRTTFDSLDNLR